MMPIGAFVAKMKLAILIQIKAGAEERAVLRELGDHGQRLGRHQDRDLAEPGDGFR